MTAVGHNKERPLSSPSVKVVHVKDFNNASSILSIPAISFFNALFISLEPSNPWPLGPYIITAVQLELIRPMFVYTATILEMNLLF